MDSLTEEKQQQQQHRYRKRTGSKRIETTTDANNYNNNKENLEERRIKTSNNNNSNRLSLTLLQDNAAEEDDGLLQKLHHSPSTQTLQMNSKDIYSGTWNPKERAVLDQVLHNMDDKGEKKSFVGKFKWGHISGSKHKDNKNINKIEEDTGEENLYDRPRDLNQYSSSDDSQRQQPKKNKKLGLFKKLKETVKQRHEEAYLDRQLQRYGVAPSPNQKKKGLLGRLTPSSKRKESGRSRAHSSNDYTRCVGVYIQPEDSESEKPKEMKIESKTSNLSKSKSSSFKNLFSSSSKAKSVENLNGAFEYYANSKQVFQRTPSMSKLNSRATSMERIDQTKRSTSQRSLDNHAFEPVKYTAKELCYEDPLVYAQARFLSAHKANQRNSFLPRQVSSDGYCSAYEDDYYRGYQSDRSPAMPPGNYYQHFNFDIPPQHQPPAPGDYERSHSSMSGYPGYYPPLPPRRATPNGYYPPPPPPPPQCQSTPLMSPYFLPAQHVPPMPGYYTPGYATPGAIYATPSGNQSGYTSEGDYSYLPYSPHFRPPPVNHGYPFVMVPHQSRKAVQRSISKNSSASNHSGNYGYGSESSYYEDDIYSMVHPPQTQNSGPQFYEQHSNSGRTSKTSQISTDV